MEKKHVCKHCFKRFPCGKSLGGHIRTHTSEERTSNASAAIADNDHAAFNFNLKLDGAGRRKKRDLWSESEASIYGLRENPKKSMRFVHSDSNANAASAAVAVATNLEQHEVEEKFCKECGKGFPSLKALCGHMACHSDKDKKINNNTKVVVMDNNNNTSSQSDTTENCVPRRSKRFKSLTLSNHNNPSSLAYELEQEELQNGAKCLILMSKDPSFIHIDHFASQNNLLFLETKSKSKSKSSSFDTTNIESRKRGNYDSLGDNFVDNKRENSWKYERLVSESSDDDGDGSADYESDENSSETDSYDSKAVVINGKKKKSSKVKKKLNLKLKSKKSSKEHECPICYRIFKSGQALGGHKRSHFVGGNEENTLVIKQAAVPVPVPVPVPCLIDLNLPAPVDE